MTDKARIGRLGEKLAERYLKEKRYQILEKNFKKLPWGEIDIIAKKDGYLIFFEVKTTIKNSKKLSPFFLTEAKINYHKKKALWRIIQIYLSQKKIALNSLWQADGLIVKINFTKKTYQLKHLKNIFY